MKLFIVFTLLLVPVSNGSPLLADEPNDNAVKQIEESGGTVRQVAVNDERVQVDFHLSRDGFKDGMLAPAARLSNVYEVHLGGTPLTDAGLASIAGLTSIERLQLQNTKIDDDGLQLVAGLRNLRLLNLYGTAISDAGLEHLAGLKNLEKLFLWQTKVTDEGVAKLQKALPDLEIDRGWDLRAPATEAPRSSP